MEKTSISILFTVTCDNSDCGDILAVGTSREEMTRAVFCVCLHIIAGFRVADGFQMNVEPPLLI